MRINKKKIACLALVTALAIPGVIGLAGCELGHTHDYNSSPFYEVVMEGETKIARSWTECSCGVEDEHKKIDNAVIVTPTTVQDALDGKVVLRDGNYVVTEKEATETYVSLNDKIIVFDQGQYNEIIHLRPSKETATIYNNKTGALLEGKIDNNTQYKYARNFTNLTFAGTENAKINHLFYVRNGSMSKTDQFLDEYIDPIKNSGEYGSYYSSLSFKSIKFSRLNFNGENGRIVINYGTSLGETIDEITVESCNFITDTPDSSSNYSQYNASSYLVAWKNNIFGTINYKNNKVDGHFQGVYTQNADEVNVVGNDISNTTHNAIAVKSGSDSFTGTIKILNNKISNTSDRAIRFGKCDNTKIYIENNTITNGVDSDNELIKSEAITDTIYILKNNTHNGILLKDVEDSKTPLLVKIIAE